MASYGHSIRYVGYGQYDISWVVDYKYGRVRYPRSSGRITDKKGAIRFAKKHGLDFDEQKKGRRLNMEWLIIWAILFFTIKRLRRPRDEKFSCPICGKSEPHSHKYETAIDPSIRPHKGESVLDLHKVRADAIKEINKIAAETVASQGEILRLYQSLNFDLGRTRSVAYLAHDMAGRKGYDWHVCVAILLKSVKEGA